MQTHSDASTTQDIPALREKPEIIFQLNTHRNYVPTTPIILIISIYKLLSLLIMFLVKINSGT